MMKISKISKGSEIKITMENNPAMDRNFIAVKENGEAIARREGKGYYLFGYIFRPIYGITLRRNIAQTYCVLPWLNELALSVSRGRVSKLRFQLNRI